MAKMNWKRVAQEQLIERYGAEEYSLEGPEWESAIRYARNLRKGLKTQGGANRKSGRARNKHPGRAMESRVVELLRHVSSDGRICPMPDPWRKLWDVLPGKKQTRQGWVPLAPPTLDEMNELTARTIRKRFLAHFKYAITHGVFDEFDTRIRELAIEDWRLTGSDRIATGKKPSEANS